MLRSYELCPPVRENGLTHRPKAGFLAHGLSADRIRQGDLRISIVLTQREFDEIAGTMKLVIEHLKTFIRCKDSLDQLKGNATSKNAMEAIDHARMDFLR
jgi:hypothetical protein